MKIAFMSGGTEPERDGVGDYTRSLAQECIRQGHECCIVALNDRWIRETQTIIDVDSDNPSELRLPSTIPWPSRVIKAQIFLDEFRPDWISLQFVPYGYHPKGLVFGLARHLHSLVAKRKLQIMFHELWIGEPANSPLKHRLVGSLQQKLMLRLIQQLQPRIVHTSNGVYLDILKRDGIKAHLLPLFSSVPVIPVDHTWLFNKLVKNGLEMNDANRSQFWIGGFFGSLPPDWSPKPLLPLLSKVAGEQARRVVILSVGNMAPDNPVWRHLCEYHSPELSFFRLGSQPAERVSNYLSSLDFGITTTSYARIGKSSAAAAMLDHGLPVIVSGNDEQFRSVVASSQQEEPLLYRAEQVGEVFAAGLRRHNPCSRLPHIATNFIEDLQRAQLDVATDEQTVALA